MRSPIVLAMVVGSLLAASCGTPEATSSRAEDAEAAALVRANAAADHLATTLRARLLAAMREGGPVAAASVCADEAQALTRDAATSQGARVGRSSLRLRNPENAAPPWVAAWLEGHGERAAEGAQGFARVEEGRARVLRPIAVEGPCVSCHGPSEAIAPEVASILRERYPEDRATGYSVGALRGALWAEVDVDR